MTWLTQLLGDWFMLCNAWIRGYSPVIWFTNTWSLYAGGFKVLYITVTCIIGLLYVVGSILHNE